MNQNRRLYVQLMYLLLGVILICLGETGQINAFWGGVGTAFVFMGLFRLVQIYRYRKDEAYREKMEVAATDERSRFIRNKAWAWAGYVFVLIAAVSTIVLKLMGEDLLSTAAGLAVGLLVLLYWVFYWVLQKKY